MEEANGVVKHILRAKFKEGITPENTEQLTKGYAKLVTLIEPMKGFIWGHECHHRELPFHQGFTHVLETTFEGVAENMLF